MAISTKAEARALTSEELDLVKQTHHPALQDVSDSDLSKLLSLLRERRNRARDQKSQQRRELRGKSAPKGATPAEGYKGNKVKAQLLAAAVARANNEARRRKTMAANLAMRSSARRALSMKQDADNQSPDINSRHARRGMRANPSERREDLVRPMERGRQRKAGAVAQAKRDAREG